MNCSTVPEVSINQQRQDNAAIDNLVKFLCNNYKVNWINQNLRKK